MNKMPEDFLWGGAVAVSYTHLDVYKRQGEVNGEVVDLRTVIEEDAELNILTANDAEGLAALRHTASHVLAEAVKRLYPEAKLAIGPSIDTGFYYDFEHEPFSSEDLESIEKEMKKIIKENAKIERFELPREEAIAFMEEKGEPYKVCLLYTSRCV